MNKFVFISFALVVHELTTEKPLYIYIYIYILYYI